MEEHAMKQRWSFTAFPLMLLLLSHSLMASDPAVGVDLDRLNKVNTILQRAIDQKVLPGGVLLIAHRGKVVNLRAFGVSDLETKRAMRTDDIFRLASATKIITSVALLTLYEEGRFGLRDPVSDYLPEFRNLTVNTPSGTVPAKNTLRIRDLLRHTSGYGYGFTDPQQSDYRKAGIMTPGPELDWSHNLTLDEWVARLATVPLADEPGTKFDYGLSSDIIGLLIERLSGQPLDQFMQERIFKPLEMTDTGFFVPTNKLDRLTSIYEIRDSQITTLDRANVSPLRTRPKALSGGGGWDNLGNNGLVSTAPDLYRFLQMLLNGGAGENIRILSRKTAELLWQNQLSGLNSPDSMWPGVGFVFGYAVLYDNGKSAEIGSPGLIWWAGSTNVHYWIDPREELIGVLMLQVRPFPYLDFMDQLRRLSFMTLE